MYLLDIGGPESSTSATFTVEKARCTSGALSAAANPPALVPARRTCEGFENVGTMRFKNACRFRYPTNFCVPETPDTVPLGFAPMPTSPVQ